MPKIKEYVSQTNVQGPALGPRATTEDLNIGKGLEQAGAGISDVGSILQKREQQADISDIHAKISQNHADSTNDLNETLRTADPGDNTIVETFMQRYDDRMSQIDDGANTYVGKQFLKKVSAEQRAHFLESVTRGQADLAGVKAKQDYQVSLNNYSSSLVNDPSSFEMVKSLNDSGLDALIKDGGLPSEAAAKLKTMSATDLAKSAVRGWIKLDPNDAQQQLDSGKWNDYIDGDAKHQLYGEVKLQISANDMEKRRQEAEKQRILAQQQTNTQNQFLQDMSDDKLTKDKVLNSNLDPFGSGSKEQFIQLLDRANSADSKIKADPGTYIALWDRVHLPDGDPKKLTNENDLNQYFGRGLDLSSVNALRGEIQNRKTEAGQLESDMKKGVIEIAKSRLVKSNAMLGIKDPDGEEQLQKFISFYTDEFQKQRQAGKSIQALTSPDSPDYLGKYISNFAQSPQQIMNSLSKSMGGSYGPTPDYRDINKGGSSQAVPPNSDMTEVIDSSGKHFFIPKENVEKAKSRGYKLAK